MGGRWEEWLPSGGTSCRYGRSIRNEPESLKIDPQADKHILFVSHIYAAVAESRQLTRRRHQPGLFGLSPISLWIGSFQLFLYS